MWESPRRERYYLAHKTVLISQVIERRRQNKALVRILLGGRCELCGYCRCLEALDFHHINPEDKEFEVSTARNPNVEKMFLEALKCALLCRNCHMEVEMGLVAPDWEKVNVSK
jgi:hypothetical protein